jgi:phage portal protein BeeE
VTDSHDRPAELHLMRPERVSVVSGADGWPAAYLYRGGGQVVRVAKEDALGRRQVAHLKALDPSDDQYGLGCLEAACPRGERAQSRQPLEQGAARQCGAPSGALVYEPGEGRAWAPSSSTG